MTHQPSGHGAVIDTAVSSLHVSVYVVPAIFLNNFIAFFCFDDDLLALMLELATIG